MSSATVWGSSQWQERRPLRPELEVYQEKIHEWEGRDGEFVLIKGGDVHGFFSSYDDALTRAYELFGLESFFRETDQVRRACSLHIQTRRSMPHFTSSVTTDGPVLNVIFSVSAARKTALEKRNQPVPNVVQSRGLVDTGASCTCVDPSVIRALGVPPSGVAPMVTPSTGSDAVIINTYDIGLMIFTTVQDPPFVIRNLAVAESDLLASQGFHALIGRDVLAKCVLIYNGTTNTYTLAF